MASGEATSTWFAAGGAAVGGGVTTVRGGAWFCAKLALHTQYEVQSNYSPALHSRHRSPLGTPSCVVRQEVFTRRCDWTQGYRV